MTRLKRCINECEKGMRRCLGENTLTRSPASATLGQCWRGRESMLRRKRCIEELWKDMKYNEARGRHRRALGGYEKVPGREHPKTLTSVYHLAFLLYQRQHYSAARGLYKRAYYGYVNILGPVHPTTLACFNHYTSAINYEEV
jgi:hypothetical protein